MSAPAAARHVQPGIGSPVRPSRIAAAGTTGGAPAAAVRPAAGTGSGLRRLRLVGASTNSTPVNYPNPDRVVYPTGQPLAFTCQLTTRAGGRIYPMHEHGSWLDKDGNGNTDLDAGHFHRVRGFKIYPDESDGHSHEMTMLPCGASAPRTVGRARGSAGERADGAGRDEHVDHGRRGRQRLPVEAGGRYGGRGGARRRGVHDLQARAGRSAEGRGSVAKSRWPYYVVGGAAVYGVVWYLLRGRHHSLFGAAAGPIKSIQLDLKHLGIPLEPTGVLDDPTVTAINGVFAGSVDVPPKLATGNLTKHDIATNLPAVSRGSR